MDNSEKIRRRFAFICSVIVVTIALLVLYKTNKPSVFLTTQSPKENYTVILTGQKERPRFFTAEVHFQVLKNGKPFWTEQYLHSGDAFDLSFEIGYPDYRWLDENILHFYNQENFRKGNPQILFVVNKTNKVVKYLKLEAWDKFLFFDIQPGSETKLFASPPKGDYPSVAIEGIFYDGQSFEKETIFKINKGMKESLIYYIHITDEGIAIESPQLDKTD